MGQNKGVKIDNIKEEKRDEKERTGNLRVNFKFP